RCEVHRSARREEFTGRSGRNATLRAKDLMAMGEEIRWFVWLVRTVHVLAGAAWVGGSLMYLFVVLPALRVGGSSPALAGQVAALFKRLVNIAIGILLLSGV